MGFLAISKLVLALILPFLIFLGVANQIAFDKQFYANKFYEYGINVPEAEAINVDTVDFVSGKTNELPDIYNEREKQHLLDVKNIVRISRLTLYSLTILFISLFLASVFVIKMNNDLANFAGKVLSYGGILTTGLASLLFVMISLNFQASFSSFHDLFFRQGTYIFDPANEMIVRLYPEELFMRLGLRIAKWVLFVSAVIIIIGIFLIVKTKTKRIKIERTKT